MRFDITCLTFSSIPPALVPASPFISSTGATERIASIIFSAPSSTLTWAFLLAPWIMIWPAGIFLSLTSPAGVLITTAERFPMRARDTGTTCFVSSDVKSNTVAMPYGFDSCSTTEPGAATSIAARMFLGTFSISETSSTIGIFLTSRLLIKTPSSRWTMAPLINMPLLTAWLIIREESSKSTSLGITTITDSPLSQLLTSLMSTVTPTPIPNPPGVEGL